MDHFSRPTGGSQETARNSSADRMRERALRLKLAAIVVLIVAGLIYNWYEQRSASQPGDKSTTEVEESNSKSPEDPASANTKTKKSAKSSRKQDAESTAEKAATKKADKASYKTTSKSRGKPDAKQSSAVEPSPPTAVQPATEAEPKPIVVENVTLKDLDGKVIYRGRIELQPTIDRIAAGKRLRFANDGSTFQNREGRLPRKPAGYYQEWVHPTEQRSGPGPQRVVTGKEGELFYTHDHYRSFKRLR